MMFVSELLKSKRSEPSKTVGPDEPLFRVFPRFSDSAQDVFAVLENDRLVGILSLRSVEQYRRAFGPEADMLTVRELMDPGVPVISGDDTLEECMALMLERSASFVPVTTSGRFAGLLTISDVVRTTMKEKEFMIAQLVSYITESRVSQVPQFAYA